MLRPRLYAPAVFLAIAATTLVGACKPVEDEGPRYARASAEASPAAQTPAKRASLIAVAKPPFSEDVFPCTQCHTPGDPVDRTRRTVDSHEKVTLRHDEKNRWCLDCHSAANRDFLHLADGRLVPFTESYRLCGQCHGPTLRHWQAGEHGKRSGSWNGEKRYLLCAHCHDPHSPSFKPMEPLAPPLRQEAVR
jgi:hypothetical protein